ncbi:MAG: glycosyltransferase family 1 protein [Muribaculaceae bacterium]|nr:glycosyltransferase family 1 protein [Muribaculaceae bacterium]
MKILLLGDYSNLHACLATGLRRMGHDAAVASDGGGFMNTEYTLSLRRSLPGPAGGAFLFAKMLWSGVFRGYDVVSIISPAFATLRPARLRQVFRMLRRHNGAVFLNAAGTDKAFMDMVLSDRSPLQYNEYFLSPGNPNHANDAVLRADTRWREGEIGRWCDEVYSGVNGITTALYEYHKAFELLGTGVPLEYVGIPVDLQSVKPIDRILAADGKVNLFLGRHSHRKAFKGTDVLERVARRVVAENPERSSLEIVENLPYAEYVKRMRSADVVIDQLYSYTPATNALLAMAAGQAVVSGGEEEYYRFIGEEKLRPIINVVPDEERIHGILTSAVQNPEDIRNRGAQGREFVERHNSVDKVADRSVKFWEANS